MSANTKLVAQAVAGNMAPLLEALRKGVPMSGPPAGDVTKDMDYPSNDLWLAVTTAYGNDEFTDQQFHELYEAAASGLKPAK